jgi:hypothetical protein
MRKPHVLSLRHLCVLTALAYLIVAANDTKALPPTFDQQAKAWNEIVALYNRGYNIIEKLQQRQNRHNPALWDQRKTMFTEAANKLDLYIRTYIKDPASITYLRTEFRLGTFWEMAQKFKSARDSYLACKNHPLFKDASSVFDGESIESQVNERLAQVEANMGKHYSRKPGYIYVHKGGGQAIFEEEDIEFLPDMVKDLCP